MQRAIVGALFLVVLLAVASTQRGKVSASVRSPSATLAAMPPPVVPRPQQEVPVAVRTQTVLASALTRLMTAWRGLDAVHRAQVLALPVGSPGRAVDDAEFSQAVIAFNTSAWSGPEQLMALASRIEGGDAEFAAVVAAYLSVEQCGSDWATRLPGILQRATCSELVRRLGETRSPQAVRVLLEPLRYLSYVNESIERRDEWMLRLPLDADSADRLLEWHREQSLSGPMRGLVETVLRSSCQYTPALLGFFEQVARDPSRDAAERSYFVRALCLSGEVRDEALPKALRFLRDEEPLLRRAAADALGRAVRVLDDTSAGSESVVAALRATSEDDPDVRARSAAFLALARFDRADARAATSAIAARAEDEDYSAWVDTIVQHLARGDSHGYRATRRELIDTSLCAARDSTATSIRRACGFWVAAHALRRDGAEAQLKLLLEEAAASPDIEVRSKLAAFK